MTGACRERHTLDQYEQPSYTGNCALRWCRGFAPRGSLNVGRQTTDWPIKSLLLHKRLHVRFLTLYATASLLFVLAWTLSYYLPPEGVLRGRTGADFLAGVGAASTFLGRWSRVFFINMTIAALFIVAPKLIRSAGGYPLGYRVPLGWAVLYAGLLGTNSFESG